MAFEGPFYVFYEISTLFLREINVYEQREGTSQAEGGRTWIGPFGGIFCGWILFSYPHSFYW